jgi:ATP-dependent Clp endopeptidase proteolytic subunit ClpP|tara:strand:- start:23 stop:625 length:603 start_codon:yes stop_codon:yes gene_type:complete
MNWTFKASGLLKEYELRSPPIIVTVNEFTEKSAKEFRTSIAKAHNTGQKVIPIIIDSYGGQVYSLMSMISAIKHAKLPVATIVEGKAMSCGAILFSFGEEGRRFMDPDATVMIHDVSSGRHGKVEEIKASAEETQRLNQLAYTMMAQNCGKADDYFLKLVHDKGHADWFLDAAESKKHNLANHLRTPEFNVKIDVNIDFE